MAGDDLMLLCLFLNKFFYFDCVFKFFKNYFLNRVMANPPLESNVQHVGASRFSMITKFGNFLKNLEIFKFLKLFLNYFLKLFLFLFFVAFSRLKRKFLLLENLL